MLFCLHAWQIDIDSNFERCPQFLIRDTHGVRANGCDTNRSTFSPNASPCCRGIPRHPQGRLVFKCIQDAVSIRTTLLCGYVAASVGIGRRLGLHASLITDKTGVDRHRFRRNHRSLVSHSSKLATARWLSSESADSSPGAMLDMLDWLHQHFDIKVFAVIVTVNVTSKIGGCATITNAASQWFADTKGKILSVLLQTSEVYGVLRFRTDFTQFIALCASIRNNILAADKCSA